MNEKDDDSCWLENSLSLYRFYVYLQICESWFQEVCDLFIVDFQK